MSIKVNSKLLRSHRRTCPYKHKLTMENAQEYLLAAQKDHRRYKNPEALELYICTCCEYLHVGHRRKQCT